MKVLVVEDDDASRELMVDSLESRACSVCAAADGNAGLALFEHEAPELVISDIRMPGIDGLELLARIRSQSRDAIVVLATAYGCEEYALAALRLGANNYLAKPVRHKELFGLVDKYRSVIESRTVQRAMIGLISRRALTMFLDNDLSMVPRVADHLMSETADALPERDRLGVHLGLVELLTNAIEHGNLGVSYDEKSEALEAGHDRYVELLERRRTEAARSRRRVRVDFRMRQSAACEWTIADEGEGFDCRSVPDPDDPALGIPLHGRGILLSRFQFDRLDYLGRGNVVRARKRLFGEDSEDGEHGEEAIDE
jgi:CheY-like chemotaxis protein